MKKNAFIQTQKAIINFHLNRLLKQLHNYEIYVFEKPGN